MSPLSLTALLFLVQGVAISVSIRRGLWHTIPSWTFYLLIATIHLGTGIVAHLFRRDYPIILLYLEPAIILGQIAFTFESSVKYLEISFRSSSPENRLLLWLIPSIPAAVVLPIEIGFIRDALSSWHDQEDESLTLIYSVRLFLSLTLLVILALIPVVARLTKTVATPVIAFHHYLLTAYLACAATGYLCKPYVSFSMDFYTTIVFFILGPLVCFLVWSTKMWKRCPSDLEPVQSITPDDPSSAFQRGALQS